MTTSSQGDLHPALASWLVTNRDRSLFGHVQDDVARAFLSAGVVMTPDADTRWHPPDDRPVCLVIKGAVRLATRDVRGDVVETAREGEIIELAAVLKERAAWDFDWLPEPNCRVLVASRGALARLLASDPHLGPYLERVGEVPRSRTFENDLRLMGASREDVRTTFAALAPLEREDLTDSKTKRAIILVARGEVIVRVKSDDRLEEVGRYATGQFFFRDGTREVGFDAVPGTVLLVLRQRAWRQAIGEERVARITGLLKSVESKLHVEVHATGGVRRLSGTIDDEDDELDVDHFTVTVDEQKALRRRRYPIVRQHDEMDCGAACLSMVARYHGRNINVPTFRSLIHVTREGSSMLQLKKAAAHVGIQSIGVMASFEDLSSVRTPFILLHNYHFTVVYEAHEDHLIVGDPAGGLTKALPQTLGDNIIVMLLKPTEALQRFPESESSFRRYLSVLREHRAELAEVAAATLLTAVLGLVSPLFMQVIFDQLYTSTSMVTLHMSALAVLVLQLFTGAMSWVRDYLTTHLAGRLDLKLGSLFLRHTLRLPVSFFSVRSVGDVTMRMHEIGRVRQFFTGESMELAIKVMTALLYVLVVGLYSWKLLLLLLIALPVQVGVMRFIVPRMREHHHALQAAGGKLHSTAHEHLKALDSIRSIHGQLAARWRWEAQLLELADVKRRAARLRAISGGVSAALNGLLSTSALVFAVVLYLRGELSLGQVVAISGLINSIVTPLTSIIAEWGRFTEVGVSLARIDDFMTSAVERDVTASTMPPINLQGSIEFQNVSFRYGAETSPLVLSQVSLTIEPGETVAFVGPSGSGKSTLAFMVNRLFTPTNGTVLLDGIPADEIPIANLRKQVGIVMQDSQLITGSILDNITLGDPRPDLDRAISAAKAADAHDFILRFPQGYSTAIKEGGTNLSGGQKQRINIARALYRDPNILVLDEATAALDAVTEQVIVRNIKARGGKRTTLIVAHRLNTIMYADKIVVVLGGQIAEVGTHKKLSQAGGWYAQMVRRQSA